MVFNITNQIWAMDEEKDDDRSQLLCISFILET